MKGKHLRSTIIKLKDGNEYLFRALPFTPETLRMPLIQRLMGEGGDLSKDAMLAMLEDLHAAISKSLSYSYSDEQIAAMFEEGVIPLSDMLDPNSGLLMEILGALAFQFNREKPEA